MADQGPLEPNDSFVIYTCLFGSYSGLPDVSVVSQSVRCIVFTDNQDLISSRWEVRVISSVGKSAIVQSRHPKILPHLYLSDFKFSLYIDANITLLADPVTYLHSQICTASMWFLPHPTRDCIYDEALECRVLERVNDKAVGVEIKRYIDAQVPKNIGLTENNFILREHNSPAVTQLMEEWWSLFEQGAGRDKLSLPVAIWKSGQPPSIFEASVRAGSNPLFFVRKHDRDIERSLTDLLAKKIKITARRLFLRGQYP